MTSAIAIVLLLLGVEGLAQRTNRTAEECLPVCVSGAAMLLFVFYCLDILRVGLVVTCACSVLLFLSGWIHGKRMIISPGIVVFVGMCMIYVLFLQNNIVGRHDELRLWGAVPKLLHETGKLQLGDASPIFPLIQPYTPGLPLLGYFFTAFQHEFQDSGLYVCYTVTTMAFLIPALSGWSWKRQWLFIPVGALLFLTPCIFTSHVEDGAMFGMSLFVDTLLGVVCGYCFYLAGHDPFRSWWDTTCFGLALGFLCLLKSTGLMFALAALVCAVILGWREKKPRLLLSAAMVAFSAGLWKMILLLHGVPEASKLNLHTLSREVIFNVLGALVSKPVVLKMLPLGYFLSFMFVFPVLLLLYYVVFRLQKEQPWRGALVIACGFLTATCAFIYGYAQIYGEELASYARYMTTPLLALFTCILLSGIPLLWENAVQNWVEQKCKPGLLKGLCVGSAVFAVLVFAVWYTIAPKIWEWDEIDAEAREIRSRVTQSLEAGEKGWIFLVIAGDGWENSHVHHRIFYDLLSADINIRNGMAETQIPEPGVVNPAASWAQALKNGSNFVYLYSIEEGFLPVFAELTDEPAQAGALYRVLPSDNVYGVTLQKQ